MISPESSSAPPGFLIPFSKEAKDPSNSSMDFASMSVYRPLSRTFGSSEELVTVVLLIGGSPSFWLSTARLGDPPRSRDAIFLTYLALVLPKDILIKFVKFNNFAWKY
jgi:hypothetical protein